MEDVNITYKGASIATMDASGTKTLTTQGKYCEGDISVAYTKPSGKETLSWHQCPEAVRNYLAYVAEHPYSASDNSTTYILDFAPDHAVVSNTKPVGFAVDGVTYRNNVPLVATPFATANKAGTLTALDQLRWFNTTPAPASGSQYEKGLNCRDLGGWACDGGTVKYGMLVRSGEINPADKALMVDEIGIKTEINLLPGDVQGRDESVWGIDYAENPTDNDFMYSISSAYSDQWLLYLQTAFWSVANSKPVIFHCGAGADKTATLACMLLGILGCSESDIDTDYELTMFSLYQPFRNRTYEAWWRFKDAIKAVPLARGLADTFQNHCASFAMSLGIQIDEINAFRSACIEGTPTPIAPTLETYTITKTLDHVTVDNEQTTIVEQKSYNANVVPASGYVIKSVSITMGGTDVTSRMFSGTETVLTHKVTNILTGCVTNSKKSVAPDGGGYVATITADTDYTLDGATVSITMGGVDVSNYYSDGKIAIPSVSGALVIKVTAVPSGAGYTNLADASDAYWKNDSRLSIGSGETVAFTGRTVTNFIPARAGDTLRIKGMSITQSLNGQEGKIVFYSAAEESSKLGGMYGKTGSGSSTNFGGKVSASGDISTYVVAFDNDNTQVATSALRYIRLDGVLLDGYTADDVIITVNEEIA